MKSWLIALVASLGITLVPAAGSLAAPAAPPNKDASASLPSRVVTLGGSVTEIVYALGEGARLVGDDLSSLYPEPATRLPRVGYYRAVPVEGVAALKPDLVLASEQAGPPEAIDRIRGLGIPIVSVSDAHRVDSLYQRIGQIAGALGADRQGGALIAQVKQQMKEVQALPARPLRALLVMNRTGQAQGAGSDTAADVLFGLAGLTNVLSDQRGYRSLSAEGFAALSPDMIVVTASSMQAMGGVESFSRSAGVAGTPAARAGRIVVMDDLLVLGLGPRLPQAVRALKQAAGADAR